VAKRRGKWSYGQPVIDESGLGGNAATGWGFCSERREPRRIDGLPMTHQREKGAGRTIGLTRRAYGWRSGSPLTGQARRLRS
jgi:hypothetical protein